MDNLNIKKNIDNDFEKILKELEQELNKLDNDGWETLGSDSIPFNMDKKNGYGFLFEVRSKETNHTIPHFHVEKSEYSGSYSISPVNKICGNFKDKYDKYIIKWGEKNKNILIEKWNSFHKDKRI